MATKLTQKTYEDARAWFRRARSSRDCRASLLKEVQRVGRDPKGGPGRREDLRLPGIPGRQRDLEVGEPRLPAVPENLEDRNSGNRRSFEGPALVFRRIEGSSRSAQLVQRIAGNGERVLPVRSRRRPRQAAS